MPIVDWMAFVASVFSTSAPANDGVGFFYILNDLPLSRERRWADASYHLLALAPLVGCSGVLGAGCPSE